MLEIILGIILVSALVASLGLAAYLEYKRYKEYKALLQKQGRFFDIAGEWFYNHMGDLP